jgi:hypothetical protein
MVGAELFGACVEKRRDLPFTALGILGGFMKKWMLGVLLGAIFASCNQTTVTEIAIYIAPQLYVKPASSQPTLRPQLSPVPGCETNCLQVSNYSDGSSQYLLYPNDILGFTFEQNFRYKLQVRLTTTSGTFSRKYELLKTLEKNPVK